MTRQYIGARYVPQFYENPDTQDASWKSGVVYEPLTMVMFNNATYTSKKEVPATIGDPASNPSYWVATGNYNGQIAYLQQQIGTLSDLETYNKTSLVSAINEVNGRIVTPEMYGAKGDGVTDDTVAIQSMFAAAPGIVSFNGNSVYIISDGIELLSNLYIMGNGATIKLASGTQISYEEGVDPVVGMLYSRSQSNIVIDKLNVDVNENTLPTYNDYSHVINAMIELYSTDNTVIRNCNFIGLYTIGVQCLSSSRAIIDNCKFTCGDRAQGLRGEFIRFISHNSHALDNLQTGISCVTNCYMATEVSNNAYGVGGVFISNSRQIKIDNNVMLKLGRTNSQGHRVQPICLYDHAAFIQITHNRITSMSSFLKLDGSNHIDVGFNDFKMLNATIGEALIWCYAREEAGLYYLGDINIHDNILDWHEYGSEYFCISVGSNAPLTKYVEIPNITVKRNWFNGRIASGCVWLGIGVNNVEISENQMVNVNGTALNAIRFESTTGITDSDNVGIKNIKIHDNYCDYYMNLVYVDSNAGSVENMVINHNVFNNVIGGTDRDGIVLNTSSDKIKIDDNVLEGYTIVIPSGATNTYLNDNVLFTTATPIQGSPTVKDNNYNNGTLIT